MNRKRTLILMLALVVLPLLLTGCAAGNPRFEASPAGFWAGLWHGLIIFITLIISLFNHNVHIYEANNVGWWYDLGYFFGVVIALGGGGFGGGRRRRRRT